MSLVDEVLAQHGVCHGANCGSHPVHCEAHREEVIPWPCESVRLATELQAARERNRLLEAYAKMRPDDFTAFEEGWALARYDEGRTQ